MLGKVAVQVALKAVVEAGAGLARGLEPAGLSQDGVGGAVRVVVLHVGLGAGAGEAHCVAVVPAATEFTVLLDRKTGQLAGLGNWSSDRSLCGANAGEAVGMLIVHTRP